MRVLGPPGKGEAGKCVCARVCVCVRVCVCKRENGKERVGERLGERGK